MAAEDDSDIPGKLYSRILSLSVNLHCKTCLLYFRFKIWIIFIYKEWIFSALFNESSRHTANMSCLNLTEQLLQSGTFWKSRLFRNIKHKSIQNEFCSSAKEVNCYMNEGIASKRALIHFYMFCLNDYLDSIWHFMTWKWLGVWY